MSKTIYSHLVWNNQAYQLEYSDLNSFAALPKRLCEQVYGVCFYGSDIVVVKNNSGGWSLPGGHIEEGETFDQTLSREVQEEANMQVVKSIPIGVQQVTKPDGTIIYQLRFCAIVEPIGKFEKDPAGSVVEMKLINPKDYKLYFDWGEIGERIIDRAIGLKSRSWSKFV